MNKIITWGCGDGVPNNLRCPMYDGEWGDCRLTHKNCTDHLHNGGKEGWIQQKEEKIWAPPWCPLLKEDVTVQLEK